MRPLPNDSSSPVEPRRSPHHVSDVARDVARVALLVLAALALSVVIQLVVVSRIQHRAAQQRAYDRLRKEIADGVAPLGPSDHGTALRPGRPVALLTIPSIHLREAVLEGTSSGVLMAGPGHRRDSPMPGQGGTSVIYGRQASYGGPFSQLSRLKVGSTFTVTTQAGISTFRVVDKRRAGDLAPQPVKSGSGRVVLTTATGTMFFPSGVLRVDADLTSVTLATGNAAIPAVPPVEGAMAADTTTMWTLVLWLQGLVVVAVAAVWAWHRWGRLQTWIVFLPLGGVVGYWTANQFMKLLPNLL